MYLKRALVVAIGEFEHSSAFPHLKGSYQSASAYDEWLSGRVPNGNVFQLGTLAKPSVSLERFWRTLRGFRDADDENGENVSLIYIASHGLHANGEDYVVLSDTSAEVRLQSAIKISDILLALKDKPSKHFVLIVDTCRELVDLNADSRALGACPSNVTVIFAVAEGESNFTSAGISNFTECFFEALRSSRFSKCSEFQASTLLCATLARTQQISVSRGQRLSILSPHIGLIKIPRFETPIVDLSDFEVLAFEFTVEIASQALELSSTDAFPDFLREKVQGINTVLSQRFGLKKPFIHVTDCGEDVGVGRISFDPNNLTTEARSICVDIVIDRLGIPVSLKVSKVGSFDPEALDARLRSIGYSPMQVWSTTAYQKDSVFHRLGIWVEHEKNEIAVSATSHLAAHEDTPNNHALKSVLSDLVEGL